MLEIWSGAAAAAPLSVINGSKIITDFLQEPLGFCKKTQKKFNCGKIYSN